MQKYSEDVSVLAVVLEDRFAFRSTLLRRSVVLIGSGLLAVCCDGCQSSRKPPGVPTEPQETAIEKRVDSSPPAPECLELEYDEEAYDRLTKFLETDRSGMRIDDFLTEIDMGTAKYTDLKAPRLPEGTRERLYHFDGFYMIVDVDCILARGTYTAEQLAELHERNEVVIGHMLPVVRVDGIRDPKKRAASFCDSREF